MDTKETHHVECQDIPASGVVENDEPGSVFELTGASLAPWRRRSVMLSLCLALFLSALDVTIVATALPTIAKQINASAAAYAWIGSAYTLSSTASVPVWAQLSNIFGRKPIIMIANFAFLGGSLIRGVTKSVGMLIGGRVVQGLGSGGCLIMVTVIIGDMFEVKERAKYYGLTGIVWAISSSFGPILGGVFTQTIGWRWCFLINLPFDSVSLGVLFFALKSHAKKIPIMTGLKSLDWIGSVLIIGGAVCFLYGLQVGASVQRPWKSTTVICQLVFGVVILGMFGFYEARFATNPLIPGRILSSRTNFASIIVLCFHSFVFVSYDYFLPLYFQVALGFDAIISGVCLLALVMPLSAFTMGIGWYVRRKGDYQWPIWTLTVIPGPPSTTKMEYHFTRLEWDTGSESIGWGQKATALHIAALRGNLDGIRALADNLGDVDIAEMASTPDGSGRLPLHWTLVGAKDRRVELFGRVDQEEITAHVTRTVEVLLKANPDTLALRDQGG
ncbi:hypothetical protein N7508_001941 [Penicillium antarcticum]|uniref:uncharacterized protein n=1 Tax=Penicillium antarcticum TaxID=416450 RepID=UPI0023891754|nr:uncharacterized protein N7508_001941 [Penicillium antarcticum]KAJ5317433.1 hypothetical protein N7508_001941 [Penicillium antarcticum]